MRRHRRDRGRHPRLEAGGQGGGQQRDRGHVCVSRGHGTCHADPHCDPVRPGAGDGALLSILRLELERLMNNNCSNLWVYSATIPIVHLSTQDSR